MMVKFACLIGLLAISGMISEVSAEVIFQDDFARQESDDSKEELGNGWSTNSRSRAKGNKQVDLMDGAMFIRRHEVADHGVSVVQDLDFKDAKISLRFKLGDKDDLGINIADMNEKSVHAGHLCMARVTTWNVELHDLKTGRMRSEIRDARKAGTLTAEAENMLKDKTKRIKNSISKNQWHDLEVVIEGAKMTVSIDGKEVGDFESEGIDHDTKRRIRLAVNKSAWVDDMKVESL